MEWNGLVDVSSEDYHNKSPGLSSTYLKEALRSPAHAFFAAENRKETPAMRFGTHLHCAILEPDVFEAKARCYPEWKHTAQSKIGKEEREEFKRETAGCMVMDQDDYDTIFQMREAAYRLATFRWLMDGAKTELACYWQAPCGELLKAKADIWRGGDVIADLKTTDDATPEAFGRTILDYQYHLSAAHYAEGFQAVTGDAQAFVWIAMEKKPPYGIAFYFATPEQIAIGMKLRNKALEAIKAWRKAGDLRAVYPDSIVEAQLPVWYMRRFENE